MRQLSLVLLLVGACEDGSGSGKGGGADDTDPGGDTDAWDPIVYTEIDPVVRFNRDTFEDIIYVSHIPTDPIALVYLFHGTGGGAEQMTETIEMIYVLNQMIPRGIGFLAIDSINQDEGLYDVSSRADANEDFQLHVRMRDTLIAAGAITAETPIFGLGFSAGGGYTSYFGHAGLREDWPMRGLLFHNAGGRSSEFGDAPELPCMWLCTVNDDRVDFDGAEEIYQDHVDEGNIGVWAPIDEIPLYPTRFVRTGDFSVEQSQHVFDEAVRGGYFDERGARLFTVAEIPAKVAEFTNNYDVIYPKPVTAQLNVVLASHAINGAHAVEEADFVEQHASP